MKLYYAPNTCSLSPHIVLRELGLPFELVRVDNRHKTTETGEDFLAINPKGYVAALALEDGSVLTEGPAILLYLADLSSQTALAPPAESWERYRLQEWLAFINSEIHAGLAPLFNERLPETACALFRDKIFKRFDYLESVLSNQSYLMGESFGVADAYLYTVTGWCRFFGIALAPWPTLASYVELIGDRPAVRAARQAGGT
ncbi:MULTISPECIES: glutathione transferase GstA [Halomonadaceae]|uniref:glutathione transferase GstA n=1 Tax=Halomonadaceae TaxID=28256 RepID=UPI001584229F|nr:MULTISPECIES: glutathione transferase GstA [Halomonas]MDI4637162.1 glutathione transferase GstA [Halomonas sp. BMC7]NUJ58330.1 glutathione transferase GstA [Halomonas taeanensis]